MSLLHIIRSQKPDYSNKKEILFSTMEEFNQEIVCNNTEFKPINKRISELFFYYNSIRITILSGFKYL